jgi:protein-tyrosine phosphatase
MSVPSRFVSLAVLALALGCQDHAENPAAAGEHSRAVPLDGQANFRDIGGYRTADGRTVRWGEVYRSGRLDHLSDPDVARLDSLEIRTVVNFLTPDEVERGGPDRLPHGVREIPLPIVSGNAEALTGVANEARRTGDFSLLPPTINPEIHQLIITEATAEYAALLRAAADPANRPLVLHCSHGVHRTGTASAILLSALGVPWETVREDYLLSNGYRAEEVEGRLAKLREMAAASQGVAPEDVDMAGANAFYVLEGSYIDASLDEAVARFGSMEGYIRDGLGLSDEEVAKLRATLLVGAQGE